VRDLEREAEMVLPEQVPVEEAPVEEVPEEWPT
jgi:hypothetical protein